MRDLDSGLQTAMEARVVRPVVFVEIEFISGWLRVWSGLGDFSWDGKTWTGVGDLGKISEIHETGEVRAAGLTLSLSGINSALLGSAIGDVRQGKPANVYFGALDEDNQTLPGVPYGVFVGRVDTCQVHDGGDVATISLNVENRLIEVERPRFRRWTHEDQKLDYPTDKGFEQVANLWKNVRLPTAADTRPGV